MTIEKMKEKHSCLAVRQFLNLLNLGLLAIAVWKGDVMTAKYHCTTTDYMSKSQSHPAILLEVVMSEPTPHLERTPCLFKPHSD